MAVTKDTGEEPYAIVIIGGFQDFEPDDPNAKIQMGETDGCDAILSVKGDVVDYMISKEDKYASGTRPSDTTNIAAVTKDNGLNYDEAIRKNPNAEERKQFEIALYNEWDEGIVGKKVIEYMSEDDVPEGTVIGNLMTIFCVKRHHEPGPLQGKIRKYKARVVFRGDQVDTSNMTKDQTYAPTADLMTGRLLMAMTKTDGVHSVKADVTGAFLNASPTSRVIARTSQGCHRWDPKGRRLLAALLMNLYGSVEAAARWCAICVQQLLRMGLRQSLNEPCLFRFAKPAKVAAKEMAEWEADPDQDLKYRGINTADEERKWGEEWGIDAKDVADGLYAALDDAFDSDASEYLPQGTRDSRDVMESVAPEIHYYNGPADHHPDIMEFDYGNMISEQPSNDEDGITWLVMSLYVDDVLIVSNSAPFARYMRKRFLHLYPGTHENYPGEFLGQVMTRGNGTVQLDQDVLLLQTIDVAHMSGCRHSKVPMTSEIVVGEPDQIEAERHQAAGMMDAPRFNGKVGYLRHGHPWSVFHHAQFSRVATRPTVENIKMMKRWCRYLASQQSRGVKFRQDIPQEMVIYVDTSFDKVTFTGIFVFALGGCVYAKSLRQRFISLSTFDAELAGMSEAAKVALQCRAILRDCGVRSEKPTLILGDNKAAVDELTNFKCGGSRKARHHRVRAAWTKQLVGLKLIEFKHIPTDENIADLGTKAMGDVSKWSNLRDQMMGVTKPVAMMRIAEETGRV